MPNERALKRFATICFTLLGISLHNPDQVHAADPGLLSVRPTVKSDDGSRLLNAGDKLQMLVYREADLTSLVTVDKDGGIVLPLIGELKVSGMTVKQARARITDLYNRDFLVNPQITLNPIFEELERARITVNGRVGSAGAFELPKGQAKISLLEAVALAGGFTRYANSSSVKVRRREGDKEKVFTVNAKKLADDPKAEQFFVIPGDHISVPERFF
ncbi:MAG: polysaccharide biosynthesis/export family protein [Limisphaerales bacterium]